MKQRRKTILRILLAALLAGVLLPLLGLLLAPSLLCVSDPLQKAEVIILLGGDDGSRMERVVELYQSGWAPRVIISGDWPGRKDWLMKAGVPERAILVEEKSGNTAENAIFSIRLMREQGWDHALVVTSWWHTRRARNCFRHYGKDIKFIVQPTWQSAEVAKSWGSPNRFILKEYLKNIWYGVDHGVPLF